ncbi:peptidase M14 [Rhizosaccharibacter radicis]|uniref:Succinylglutamate desuccinylase/aspartoacylase family protein n=1 Tax=Rhizosaccharibacter radicis TaxID=2782605 RepID=A0ABT1VYL0_9PROT|nr:succinylglutamate desuccinylase/aspartoacylase family protein [Acetobacteraceae bacterium KSS12]
MSDPADILPPSLGVPPPLPRFAVNLRPPDLSPWRAGNAGIPGVMRFDSGRAGPHVVLSALMHGNEFAGAIVLDELLRGGFTPEKGRLSVAFLNLDAFSRFDRERPTASRFVDEDMNRLWDPAILGSSRDSSELRRAREVLPLVEQADLLLDLHSMLWPSEALILSGPTAKGLRLGTRIGIPATVIADAGHRSGPRLIDYRGFTDRPDTGPAACLLEAGPHWEPETVDIARRAVRALLLHAGLMSGRPEQPGRPRLAEVTHVVTAATGGFSFTRPYRGSDIVAEEGTVIARDGGEDIRTPFPDCMLVMPSLRPSRGHTAVRLARLLREDEIPA